MNHYMTSQCGVNEIVFTVKQEVKPNTRKRRREIEDIIKMKMFVCCMFYLTNDENSPFQQDLPSQRILVTRIAGRFI